MRPNSIPRHFRRVLVVAILFSIATPATVMAQQGAPRPATVPVADVRTASPFQPAGDSAGGQKIEIFRAGTGPRTVAIIGSLYGNEPQAVRLVEEAAALVQKYPPPEQLTFLLVRVANPDGYQQRIVTNQRGVDLNRNFPAGDTITLPGKLNGPHPASEPETQFLVKLLTEARPARVIHVTANYTLQSLLQISDQWPDLPPGRVLPIDLAVTRMQGGLKIGSLERFVRHDLNAEVATVYVAPPGGRQIQAQELLRFASALVSSPSEVAQQPPSAHGPRASRPLQQPASPVEERMPVKEVEFLPPPPEYLATSNAGPNGAGLHPKFEELPPPPRQR